MSIDLKIELKRLQDAYAAGRYDDAEARARRMVLRWPKNAQVLNALGAILGRTKKNQEALRFLQRAVDLSPGDASTITNLGSVLFSLDRTAEAETTFARALSITPDLRAAHRNLSKLYVSTGRFDAAARALRTVLRTNPDDADTWSELGIVENFMGLCLAAEDSHRQALSLQPLLAKSLVGLAISLAMQGRIEEARKFLESAVLADPENPTCLSPLLMLQTYETCDRRQLQTQASRFGVLVEKAASDPFSRWRSPGEGKLRIGLVSGDLREHPVGFFLEGVLSQLNRRCFEVFAYSTNAMSDALTARLQGHVDTWRTIANASDREAAATIHNDGIHVLVDLSGHTEGNRLAMFAWRPAPLQVSWLGYWSTTGVRAVDFVIADATQVPEGTEDEFVERIWRLPHGRLCFTPPADAIDVAPLPALSQQGVTFGCFNSLQKLSAGVIELWARILDAVPASRLYLKARQLEQASVSARVRDAFQQSGIDSTRLILDGVSERSAYLRCYDRVDIALDPFPFTGGTTTAESLWMGVPVITLAGATMVGRQGASLLTAAGLDDWIARSEQEYLVLAVRRANDIPGLQALRLQLRRRVLDSPLFNAAAFARDFEEAVKSMWESTGSQRVGAAAISDAPGR